MPAFLEKALKTQYAAKGKSGRSLDHAVYGTMNKMGAMRGNKITAKGKALDRKHKGKFKKKSRGSQADALEGGF